MSIVFDYHGNARPPYSGAAVQPLVAGRCWACGGTGWRETGMHEGTNVGIGARCVHCAGSGVIWREAEAA